MAQITVRWRVFKQSWLRLGQWLSSTLKPLHKKTTVSAAPLANRRTVKQQHGELAESLVFAMLQHAGLRPVARNYRCRYGEIDLIFRDQTTLIFVEVRARSSRQRYSRHPLHPASIPTFCASNPISHSGYGGAIASITPAKQQRLWHTAQHFLRTHKLSLPCRFDAVLLDGITEANLTYLHKHPQFALAATHDFALVPHREDSPAKIVPDSVAAPTPSSAIPLALPTIQWCVDTIRADRLGLS